MSCLCDYQSANNATRVTAELLRGFELVRGLMSVMRKVISAPLCLAA